MPCKARNFGRDIVFSADDLKRFKKQNKYDSCICGRPDNNNKNIKSVVFQSKGDKGY